MSLSLTARRFAWNLSKWRPLRLPLEAYRHRGLDPQDVFIACYPRSGSTWLRFMLCDILQDVEPDFGIVNRTIPDIGLHCSGPVLVGHEGRLVKTHERYLSRYHKAVYLVRDVRDVVLSEHRHQQMEGMFLGDFDHFVHRFTRGRANAFARWDDHVNGWLDAPIRRSGNLLVIRFEQLRGDPAANLTEILKFLGRPADASRIQRAVERNDLRHMQDKEHVSPQGPGTSFSKGIRFVSQGEVKGWRSKLAPHHVALLNECFSQTLKRLEYDVEE